MVTGFLPAIYRFKVFSAICLFILILNSNLILCSKVYASPWFAVNGSGVLSGGNIVNNNIPTSGLPFGFNSSVVQPNSGTRYGSLVSGGGVNINTSDDAYIENVDINYYKGDYPDLTNLDVNQIIQLLNLDPGTIYKASDTAALESILSANNYYSLTSDGLVLIFVSGGGPLNINQPLYATETNSTRNRKRLLLITDQQIIIGDGVGTSYANFSSLADADIQAGLVSYYLGSKSLQVSTGTNNPIILEGPVAGFNDLALQRDLGEFPGVYVKYNPFYVAELSKKGVKGLAIKGLLESKTSWRYD